MDLALEDADLVPECQNLSAARVRAKAGGSATP
jgi:hypothetical protein